MNLHRYARQTVLAGVGSNGQKVLLRSRVAIIGVGAIGTVVANNLARSGVGFLRIVDRDIVEISNLQRQTLYTEDDAAQLVPKAIAAYQHLKKINSEITIEPIVTDVNAANIESLLRDVDLVLDGSDNIEVRYLINEACFKLNKPWIYAGAMMNSGLTMNILPGETACFRCICPDAPPPGSYVSCSTVGVLNMITGSIAAIESAEAIKILLGSPNVRKTLMQLDVWYNSAEYLEVQKNPECPTCGQHHYDYLEGYAGTYTTSLCNQNAIQVVPTGNKTIDFQAITRELSKIGTVKYNTYMLSFSDGTAEFNLFPDGRAIMKNCRDENAAKSVYTEYIGF